MPNCSACGMPLVRQDGLLKCKICGLLYPLGQDKPILSNYAQVKQMEKIAISTVKNEEELAPDQLVFINRVCQGLIPIATDYPPETKTKLLGVQGQIRKELKGVFSGKESLEKWFNKTRSNLGLHAIDLTQILYDSLEGLESEDAKALREQYGQALNRIIASYHPQV